MPRKTKTSAAAQKAALPQIPADFLEQLIPRPVTPAQFEDIFQNFKKAFVERALGAEMSQHLGYQAGQAKPSGATNHHSDRGSQYVSIRYSERLAEAGIEPSVGSNGDSYDNALAETINGLYKAELIHRRAPWKTKESVELATLEWVSWFNHHRLLEPIGYIPPAEAEANYYRQLASQATEVAA